MFWAFNITGRLCAGENPRLHMHAHFWDVGERKRLLAGSNPRLHVAWSTSGTQRIEERVEKVGTADWILHDPDIA